MILYIVSNIYHKISCTLHDPLDPQNLRNDSFSQWINFSLICPIDTMFSFILSRRAKYLILIYLQALIFFILLEYFTTELSQYIFISLLIESIILGPVIKFHNLIAYKEVSYKLCTMLL